jgi:hypothetical protein
MTTPAPDGNADRGDVVSRAAHAELDAERLLADESLPGRDRNELSRAVEQVRADRTNGEDPTEALEDLIELLDRYAR